MGPVKIRQLSRGRTRRALLLMPAVGVFSLVLALGLAGCGDNDTTTTTSIDQPEQTTTTALPGELTTSTEPSGEDTTTSLPGEDTTTSSAAVDGGTTTTEKLSTAEERLGNGHIKAMGFIKKVYLKDGKRYISIDYAEMLGGEEARQAAVEAGVIEPGEDVPNDYFIRNVNTEKREFEISGTAAITASTWDGEFDKPITWEEFVSLWSATPPAGAEYLRNSPWWIERDGPVVIKIDEQYLP